MNLEEILNFRRAVRYYDSNKEIDKQKVRDCLKFAALAPSSSNMQLWEFYHIVDADVLKRIATTCMSQSAATTAKQIVVFVTRQDLHRKRAKTILNFEIGNVRRNSPLDRQEKRIKNWEMYYGKMMPFIYSRFFGIIGIFRKILAVSISLFKPMVTNISENDARVVVHKSCGLAAQTFMIAMANEGYDTCPLEGFDSRRLKKILNLPYGAEINMVIPCGIRNEEKGIWGERYRVPFDDVYKTI